MKESELKKIIKEEVENYSPKHFGMSGYPTNDEIVEFAESILSNPDSLSQEEKEAIKKLLRNRAERLRRGIEGEQEMYPGSGDRKFSKDPKHGAYASLRKNMIDKARKI